MVLKFAPFAHLSALSGKMSEAPPEYLYDTSSLGFITAQIGLGFIVAITLVTTIQTHHMRLKLLAFIFMVESTLYFSSLHFQNGIELLVVPSISFVIETFRASSYSIMNYTRLRYFIRNKYHNRVIRLFDICCLLTVILVAISDTTLIVAQVRIYESTEDAEATLEMGNLAWNIYSIYDAVFNFLVSIRFAIFLKTLANPALKAVVQRCQLLLLFECIFILVSNVLVLSQLDTNFTSAYVAIAIRIYLFSEFLKGLKKVMRDTDTTDRYFSKEELADFKSSVAQKSMK
ncbi:hypothetical protein BKA69DRAFT_1080285 [Paraphysoderma sedebokerense]|nr:hypothetical protein BKA69DRAFT_1080285 [Paraphysoderma sedebokerense]